MKFDSLDDQYVQDVAAINRDFMGYIFIKSQQYGADQAHKAFIYTILDYLCRESDAHLLMFAKGFNMKRVRAIKDGVAAGKSIMMFTTGDVQ